MTSVYVGITVQIVDKGFLSSTAFTTYSFFGPLLIAGMLHMEEAYCMFYMPVYLVTIPSMYILLVVYSFFNLWNVSWGTREVATKKSKAELEREAKEQKEREAELKKKKKEGLFGTLMDQFNLGGEKGDTASVDFSIGNVLRCMCFSHEDPLEPKKQLVKIAATLDEVSKRLNKMELATGTKSFGVSRRNSSHRGSVIPKRSLGNVNEMAGPEQEMDDVDLDESFHDDDSSDEGSSDGEKVTRNDELNPYWIEDKDLKKGEIDFLPGAETKFWKDLITKYLTPLQMTKKEKGKYNK